MRPSTLRSAGAAALLTAPAPLFLLGPGLVPTACLFAVCVLLCLQSARPVRGTACSLRLVLAAGAVPLAAVLMVLEQLTDGAAVPTFCLALVPLLPLVSLIWERPTDERRLGVGAAVGRSTITLLLGFVVVVSADMDPEYALAVPFFPALVLLVASGRLVDGLDGFGSDRPRALTVTVVLSALSALVLAVAVAAPFVWAELARDQLDQAWAAPLTALAVTAHVGSCAGVGCALLSRARQPSRECEASG